MDIGFIGLGVMGEPMAGHLAKAGHRLTLLDIDEVAARKVASALDATLARTPAEVARASEVVITMLPNGEVVAQVALGTQGLIHGLRPGTLLLVGHAPQLLAQAGHWHGRSGLLCQLYGDAHVLELAAGLDRRLNRLWVGCTARLVEVNSGFTRKFHDPGRAQLMTVRLNCAGG